MKDSIVSRRSIFVIAAISIAAIIGSFLWRDLHLTGSNVKIPDIVVENINMERDINGKHWTFISPRVEHRDGRVYGDSLDVTIDEGNGKQTKILAKGGTFARANNDLTLDDARGTLVQGGKAHSMTAGSVFYKASEELWTFSRGIVLSDDKTVISGRDGSFASKTGECALSGDCVVTWGD